MPSSNAFELTEAGPIQLYSVGEMLNFPAPRWQIDDLIPENSFTVLFGPSGAGKSFVAIDMALSVGSGFPWQGKLVEKGFAVYVSAEGTAGLGQRIRAWMLKHGALASDIDAAFVTEAVPMHTESEYLDFLLKRFDEIQRVPSLVVLDTLARNFVGDENETEDMSTFVKAVDVLRAQCGCTVLAIHHTNVSEGRERGNGALRGATDTMIRLSPGVLGSKAQQKRGDVRFTLSCEKQKEAIGFTPGIGRIETIALGTLDQRGKEATSGVANIYEWLEEEEQ